ncbi:MAG TPA: hypothetical protein VNB29_08280 [Chthoniobacterales bacterium]|nr:hypothetical protein [Chthoniobacterales bacterium]
MSTETSSSIADQLAAALRREPFEPFRIETTDGRTIAVKDRHSAVLNSLAISVVEEAFSVTVVALEQVAGIFPAGK